MAVPEGERRPCKMDVFMHELDLVTYTLQITRNEKIFLPEYKGCVTDDIVETAKNIYIDSWDANNIRVQKRGDSNWEERSRLQLRAARNCNRLLATRTIRGMCTPMVASATAPRTGLIAALRLVGFANRIIVLIPGTHGCRDIF